jgi:hypothetical protein
MPRPTTVERSRLNIRAVEVGEYAGAGLFIAAIALLFGLVGGLLAGAVIAVVLAEVCWSGHRIKYDPNTKQEYRYGPDNVWSLPLPKKPKPRIKKLVAKLKKKS